MAIIYVCTMLEQKYRQWQQIETVLVFGIQFPLRPGTHINQPPTTASITNRAIQ